MARLNLTFPDDQFYYSTTLTVRVTDINGANHLGNDEVGVMDFNKYGGDITFRITRPADNTLVAMAKSGFVCFAYKTGKVMPMPEEIHQKFPRLNWVD